MYQSLKYFMARIGLSIFLLLTLGYAFLYFIHEVALPGIRFDDTVIQWVLVLISVFFGFFAYGMIGEQRFLNAFHVLKDLGSHNDVNETIGKFEDLLLFTGSSHFLPGQGGRFRDLVIRRYADYLLSVGREDASALRIYLKAFLLNPKNSRFRAPLLSVLGHGGGLSPQEIDLLLVMLKAEDFQDDVITTHLASIFLEEKKFTAKTAPLFLRALENQSRDAKRIAEFAFPILLENNREDEFALRFYLHSLQFHLPGEDRARAILARAFCKGYWEGIDSALHERCGQLFFALDPARQAELRQEVDDDRISKRLQKFKLFSREDLRELEHLKVRLGIVRSAFSLLREGFLWPGRKLVGGLKGAVLTAIDGLIAFGKLRLGAKLVSVSVLFAVILLGLSMTEWIAQRGGVTPLVNPSAKKVPVKRAADENRIHTIQVGAVISQKQADGFVRTLKKRGIKGAYIIKSPRQDGGNWYKIRVGQFTARNEARKFANGMIIKKYIRNYFLISLPGGNLPRKENKKISH